ncbi:conserved unknown protein [Ectocarpus siliculosus]|uniref:Uncharacterized protein n=1 Tax=Ectocarpus siliculosus TaxID=2880 RepID=D7G1U0_ECTSI|nr:conserved unknown protein [Ectocarpus siliculosus]|eukprot:CBJ48666.1 conserved unknown protein [Ectocarpus siliculosus]
MASKVEGQESQMVTFELEPGQVIRAEAGNLVFMEDGIEMDTNTGGGASSMFRRVITGQNMFVTDYVNRGDASGKVGLGTDVPSKIVRLPLAAYGGEVICQRGAFLAGSHTIDIQTEFTKMMAGFFGGEGFVLQRLTGKGDAFVKASGPLIQRELSEGETLRVSSGSVVAFSTSVQYDVQTIPGFKNVVFGGEGLFITKLAGPGTVFLQGLPFDRMVDQIARRIPGGRGGGGMPIPIGVGGGGGEGGEDAGGEGAGAEGGDGVAAAVATGGAGEESTMSASDAGTDSEAGSSNDLFGDAAPPTSSASTGFPEGEPADGFNEADAGFSEPPPESGETTWNRGGFDGEDAAGDGGGGGGDWGEGMGNDEEGTGGGIVGTLKSLYTLFRDDDGGFGGGGDDSGDGGD